MKAVFIPELTGPSAASVEEVPEPEGTHHRADGRRVLVEVHAVGLSFIDPLQTRGKYQSGLEAPYIAGSELAGLLLEAPEDSTLRPGERVAGIVWQGALAERALAIEDYLIRIPEAMDIARAQGISTIALVYSDEKEWVARESGATHVVRSNGAWLDEVKALTSGRGVQGFIDMMGGDGFLDTVRALAVGGSGVIVGFAGGTIPEIKVNRLLLRNLTLTGIAMDVMEKEHPGALDRVRRGVQELLDSGKLHRAVENTYSLTESAQAFESLENRTAVGKVVVTVKEP